MTDMSKMTIDDHFYGEGNVIKMRKEDIHSACDPLIAMLKHFGVKIDDLCSVTISANGENYGMVHIDCKYQYTNSTGEFGFEKVKYKVEIDRKSEDQDVE
jgi:hypothetical protein